jgi:hypothetical protein
MVSPPPIMAARDDGAPPQPITAVATVVVGIDPDEPEPVAVKAMVMAEEHVMWRYPSETSGAAVVPGFSRP